MIAGEYTHRTPGLLVAEEQDIKTEALGPILDGNLYEELKNDLMD